VQPEELGVAIRQAVADGAERRVYLQVDSRARYGRAEIVLDQIREAGIRDISVLAEKPY
jgi:biopolymer transport protein ExbD